MSFAARPPTEGGYLTTRLWDRFLPRWRVSPSRRSEAGDKKVMEKLRPMIEAAKRRGPHAGAEEFEAADSTIFERKVPVRRGKWRLLPPEVENDPES